MHVRLNGTGSTGVLAGGWEGAVVLRRPGLRDRLVVRLRRRRLDRELATGIAPETSVALALRAQRLTEPDRRRSIARELRRIIREAQVGYRPKLGQILPSRARVTAAREELIRLADTLDEPGPVAAGGVAQAWMLLTDGTGPLYNADSRASLRAGAARAVRELRPWPA